MINPLQGNLAVDHSAINYDLNNLTKGGIYNFVDASKAVANNPGVDYGMVIVFVAAYSYIVQLAIVGSKMWFRFINPQQGQYNAWKAIV